MYRGTTPTLTLNLPFAVGLIDEVSLGFAQEGKLVLEKTKEDCSLIGQKIEITLTQEDTLHFDSAKPLEFQVRILDKTGQALASKIYSLKVDRILRDGVIYGD